MPNLVISSAENAANSDSPEVTIPAAPGINAGDFIVATLFIGDDVDPSAIPDGFTALCDAIIRTTGDDRYHRMYFKEAVGDEESETLSWTLPTAENYTAGVLVIRGVDAVTRADVAINHATQHITGQNDPSPTVEAITPVTDGALIIEFSSVTGAQTTSASSSDGAATKWIDPANSYNCLATWRIVSAGLHSGSTHTYVDASPSPEWITQVIAVRPQIFSGAGALALAAVLLAGTGTFAPPVYAGTGGITTAPIGLAGTGTYTPSGDVGDGGLTTAPVGLAGTGTFTPPVYTGDGGLGLAPVELGGTGTHAVPVYSGDGGLALAPVGLAGTGTFTPPGYAGDGGIATAPIALAGTGTFTPPIYIGDGGLTVAPIALGGAGIFAPPVYTGDGGLIIAPVTFAGVGLYAVIYDGTGGLRLAPVRLHGEGSYELPSDCLPLSKVSEWLGDGGGMVVPLVDTGGT